MDNPLPKDVMERYELQDRQAEQGYVRCDQFCLAKEKPETLEEYRAAWEHWKSHHYLHGCSHGD